MSRRAQGFSRPGHEKNLNRKEMPMLDGKRLIFTGIVNDDSIAFVAAQKALDAGAEVLVTAFPRDRELTEGAAGKLSAEVEVVELDITDEAHLAVLSDRVADKWGGLDGILHAVAFAPQDALAGDFLEVAPDRLDLSFKTSAFSLASLGRVLKEHAPSQGGSLVGLDFDSTGAWPVYNWMGVMKSALESVSRYLARDLGPLGIRSNLVAAGPLNTRAAGGIPDFDQLLDNWEIRSPMSWDPDDPAPVADTISFLLSDLSRAITGEIVHVDGGYHAMAGALAPGDRARAGAA
jgi:meromycolic acid enoyl-[acyl-carrier-protein] reductase